MSRLNVLGGLVRLMMPAGVISALYAGRLAEVEGRRIDPKAQALLDLVATVRGPEPVYDVATSRAQLAGFVERFDQPGPEGVRRTEEELPGAEGVRAARVYNPEGAKPARTLLYFHGGGWIQGSIDTHDALCAKLCAGAGIRVISYDYRLAPEAPFPRRAGRCACRLPRTGIGRAGPVRRSRAAGGGRGQRGGEPRGRADA